MNITKYRSSKNEKVIFHGKASIINEFKVANADEYCYQYLGKNSCYPFSELVHRDDLQSFLEAVKKLEEGTQSIIARVKCYSGRYRCLYMALKYNGRIIEGYKSFDISFSDTIGIQEHYIKYLRLTNKYRKLISLIPVLYFEYEFSTNLLIIYKYSNAKCILLFNSNLDILKDQVISSDDLSASIKKQFEVFYDDLIRGTDQFETSISAEIFDKTKAGVFLKITSTVIFQEDSKEMIVGVMKPSENGDKEVYYLSDAARDVGTGMLNKRAISEYAIEKINSSDREIYLVMLDIDDFKKINDTYGHMFGDEVLTKVSETIISVLSSRGTVGRFGGDEFLIVIENVNEESDLRCLLKTINKHIQWECGNVFDNFKVTTSMGISKFPDDGMDYEELFNKADKSLYIAKAKGKNRYIIYDKAKHGAIKSNKYNGNSIGMNSVLNNEKRASTVSDIILNLFANGVDAIMPSFAVMQTYFDLDGISVYTGETLNRTFYLGEYIAPFEQFKLLEDVRYMEFFNENNVYVETNIHRIEIDHEEIYKEYMKQEIAEFVQCITYVANTPQVVVSFDVFNRPRKWSDTDVDFLTILGKLIGDVVVKNILNK